MLYKRTYSSQRQVIRKGAGSMMWLISSMVGFLSLTGVFFNQEKPAAADESRKANPNSTIIFFRESHITGSGLRPSVYVDGRGVARLSNGRWFSCSVKPGKHKLESSAKHQPATVVEAPPGETIYVGDRCRNMAGRRASPSGRSGRGTKDNHKTQAPGKGRREQEIGAR